jgi:hypothetical protein
MLQCIVQIIKNKWMVHILIVATVQSIKINGWCRFSLDSLQ